MSARDIIIRPIITEKSMRQNSEDNKAIPVLPVSGISPGRLEKCKNILNSLRSFIYPNVAFEVLANRHGEVNYLLIVVLRQTGGPFAVAPKAETDKKSILNREDMSG